jgi:hypothetical protein
MPPTSEEIVRAIRKNGYRKANGAFIRIKSSAQNKYSNAQLNNFASGYDLPDEEDVYAACAMGQAALNLGIPPMDLHFQYSERVFRLNDVSRLSLAEIADNLDERLGISTK